jgi:hypothetical protein
MWSGEKIAGDRFLAIVVGFNALECGSRHSTRNESLVIPHRKASAQFTFASTDEPFDS